MSNGTPQFVGDLSGSPDNDTLVGGFGTFAIWGGDGNDVITGTPDSNLLTGDLGADDMDGEAGNDFLFGGPDDDLLLGGDDSDMLIGSFGNDVIDGEAGDDLLFGGDGSDGFFVLGATGRDVIADFEPGVDTIAVRSASVDIILDTPEAVLRSLATSADGSAVLSLGGGNFVTILGLAPAQLTAADFIIADQV
ncbi:MAG TPA: calcium-binding protein [Alphaproteobacteria bacterium]